MKISIKENLLDAYATFDDLRKTQVHAAARRAINRTLVTVRKESVDVIRQGIRIKSSVLKSYISTQKPNQKKFYNMQGAIIFQSRGLALIEFLRGRKEATPQKGIKVNRRRKVKVEITPGKKFNINKGFIIKTKSKGLQIMKGKTQPNTLRMQTAPSVGALLLSRKNNIGQTLQTLARERFQIEFSRDLKARINNLINKRSKS
jgi:hypothetical protein